MARSAPKPGPAVVAPAHRVRIRFLWPLLEIEGEGLLSVVGGLVIVLLLERIPLRLNR
jgi:hypothetical protein